MGKRLLKSRSTNCNTFVEQKPGIRSSVDKPQQDTEISCIAKHCVYNKKRKDVTLLMYWLMERMLKIQ